jgi:hypothetical protein
MKIRDWLTRSSDSSVGVGLRRCAHPATQKDSQHNCGYRKQCEEQLRAEENPAEMLKMKMQRDVPRTSAGELIQQATQNFRWTKPATAKQATELTDSIVSS